MNKDPLQITTDLILNLNLISEGEEFNINSFKEMRNIKSHWITIERYLKLFNVVQKYCPDFTFEDSNFTILESKMQRNLNEKEKFILYLFNQGALNEEKAIELEEDYFNEDILESKGYLFDITENNKCFLNEAGIDLYRSIHHRITEIIINKKDIEIKPEENEIPSEEFELHQQYNSSISYPIENLKHQV